MKRKAPNNLIELGDLGFEEELEENGICEFPILGTLINTFSFQDNIPASKAYIPNVTKF